MNKKTSLLTPNCRQLDWLNRSMTAFLHFGMNTFTSNEWGSGKDDPTLFSPTELDARQWIRTLKEAGFSCAILTAKHHDGFCLWPSKFTDYTVAASPYKNGKGDIVREFTDACREYGMKAGIYLSPWDRHEPSWGSDDYNDFYVGQLTELLTNYGEIHEVWWDGAGSKDAVYDWDRWGNTVRSLAPKAVIFGSRGATPFVDVRWVGNEKGVAGIPCYLTVKESTLWDEIIPELNVGDADGDRFAPAEVDVSIRPGWFYKEEQDDFVRSPQNLFSLWLCSLGRGAGLLLNIPPDKRGLLHERDVASLLSFAAFLKKSLASNLSSAATVEYTPSQNDFCKEITYRFDKPEIINTITMKENLTSGQAIMGVEVFAESQGKWKELFTSPCVGLQCTRQFEDIDATAVRIRISKALAEPVLDFVGIYRFDPFKEEAEEHLTGLNLATLPTASVTREANTFYIDLGGVYPFNCFRMDGTDLKSFALYLFNGSSYELVCQKKTYFDAPATHRFDGMVDYAYRLKVEVEEAKHNEIFMRTIEIMKL